MFVEIRNVRQERGEGRRRWFESDGFDLVVWFDRAGCATGFQICYDFGRGEHALTWRPECGFAHSAIDTGEDAGWKNLTPILVPDGAVPWSGLRRMFEEKCGSLEAPLRELVLAQLSAGAREGPAGGATR